MENPQFAYLFELLKPFCEKVFLSCRAEQAAQFGDQFPKIYDIHDGIGPMNGLLSFFEKYPEKACLLVACDMPFIDKKTIQFLIENRQADNIATGFESKKRFPDPLLTIWEPASYNFLNKAFKNGNYSLRDILKENKSHLLKTKDDKTLLNINKPEELETVLKVLKIPPEKS